MTPTSLNISIHVPVTNSPPPFPDPSLLAQAKNIGKICCTAFQTGLSARNRFKTQMVHTIVDAYSTSKPPIVAGMFATIAILSMFQGIGEFSKEDPNAAIAGAGLLLCIDSIQILGKAGRRCATMQVCHNVGIPVQGSPIHLPWTE